SALGAHSQIDSETFTLPDELKNPLETPLDEPYEPYAPKTKPSLTNPEYRRDLDDIVSDVDSYFKEEEKPINLTTDNGLMKRKVEFTPRYLEEERDASFGNSEPQFLGEYI